MCRLWTSSRYWAMRLILLSLPFAACSPYKQAMRGGKKGAIARQEQLLKEYQTKLLQLKEDSMELARQADELVRMLGESQLKERRNAQKLYQYAQLLDKASVYQEQLEYIRRQIVHTLLTHEIDNIQVVKEKRGVRITILDELLFPPGSARINSEGQNAIKYLSETLGEIAGITIIIEGHTDNVPLRNHPVYKNNWELSLARASEVGRYMVRFNFPQDKVSISGKGDLYPLADNSTPEGRRLNRRTDIIVMPEQTEILNMVFDGLEEGNTQNTIVMPVRQFINEGEEKKNSASLNEKTGEKNNIEENSEVIYGTPVGKLRKNESNAQQEKHLTNHQISSKTNNGNTFSFNQVWKNMQPYLSGIESYLAFSPLWKAAVVCYVLFQPEANCNALLII